MNHSIHSPDIRRDDPSGGHVAGDGGAGLSADDHHELSGPGDERSLSGRDEIWRDEAPGEVAEQDGLEDGGVGQQVLEHEVRQGIKGRIVRGENGDIGAGRQQNVQLGRPQGRGQLAQSGRPGEELQQWAGVVTRGQQVRGTDGGGGGGGGQGEVETSYQRVEEADSLGCSQTVGSEMVRSDGRVGQRVQHQGTVGQLRVDWASQLGRR